MKIPVIMMLPGTHPLDPKKMGHKVKSNGMYIRNYDANWNSRIETVERNMCEDSSV